MPYNTNKLVRLV